MTAQGERRLGGFRIVAPIRDGKGSQGAVYRAVCERETVPGVAIGETVALKTMTVRDESGAIYARFAKRTDLLSRLRHQNVVSYKGCFSENGPFSSIHVAVMELLEGETLKERLARNPGGLDADEAIKIVDAALAGLEAAGELGIVHRDVKPGNIFLCSDGTVKLIDFEISRDAHGSVSTASGRFAGTFDYMAPEFADPVFRGDMRSDVFSMGVVFHEVLTGDVPYARAKEKGEQADFAFLSRWSQRQEGLCAIHVRSTVKRLLSHADEVIRKAISEDPAGRYATPTEFREGIKAIRFRELRSGTRAYRLLRVIGRGGFGEVFKARIRGTSDYVAVKHLLKAAYGDRFRREARVMRQLDDPAFVRFIDYFETQHPGGEEAFLVMAFLPGMPGMSLRDAVKCHATAPIPIKDVLKAFARYAQALSTMHRQGIFHRDIKPSNLYYPRDNPSAAAIMDLGIARDVNGTATSGQVPGTLDYMPPEVVLGGSRGDAGMDIYALGLCLYEALSGKMAYPRLPTGPTAFAVFYERARSKREPLFDGPAVEANPALLSLLQDMTAIDPSSRIHDAGMLCRRIEALAISLGEESLPLRKVPSPDLEPKVRPVIGPGNSRSARPSSQPRSSDLVPSADQNTVDTSPVGGRPNPPSPARTPARKTSEPPTPPGLHARRGNGAPARHVVKVLVMLLVVGAVAVGMIFAWSPVKAKIAELKKVRDRRTKEAIIREMEARQAQEAKIAAERAEGIRQSACNEADDVLRQFDSRAVSALAAGNSAGEWMLKWRDNPDVASIYAEQTNRFEVARHARHERDMHEKKEASLQAARQGANDLIEHLRGRNVTTESCVQLVMSWQNSWKPMLDGHDYRSLSTQIARALDARRTRDKEDAMAATDKEHQQKELVTAESKACAEADRIVARYGDENVPSPVVKAEYAIWQNDWGKFRNEAFFVSASAKIDAAARERSLQESGRAVAAECEKWLDNIATVSTSNVKNWRGNLDRAELELKLALGAGRISKKAAEIVQRRINVCRKWAVGVIDNKTHRTVEFGGKRIPPISCGTVIFTNGVPDGVAVTSEGCEPLRVREDKFDSEVVIVMRLEERRGGTQARVPQFGSDVLCLIDGVECSPGVIELRHGRHTVVYRNRSMTYPEVRDFKDQEYAFSTTASGIAEIPPPSQRWIISPEFAAAEKNAGLVARGKKIVSECETNLQPEPLETRRQRLERVYSILNDWKTASALAILGEGVERDLQAKYQEERRRIRGYVRNATTFPVSVTTDTKPVDIAPGSRAVVTFESEWRSGEAYASVPGYEFVLLPRAAEDFDGKEFVVEQEKLVGTPVKVSLPPLDDGVVCKVDARRVDGSVELRPGEYACEYLKPDSVTQRFKFTVNVGEKITLPPPGKWEPSGAMSAFSEAMSRFASGAVDEAKAITTQIGTIEDPARRRELEDLKKAIELREKLERK